MFPGRGASLKGVGYTRNINGKIYWSKWPVSQKSARTAKEQASRDLFAVAARVTLYMSAPEQAFARELADETKLLPRDLLMISLFGRVGTVINPDGRKVYSMAALQDVSDLLDAIIQIPGAIIFRGPERWQGLTIGEEGQSLVVLPDDQLGWGGAAVTDKARAYVSANYNSASNVWQKLLVNTAAFDASGLFNPAQSRFTPKQAGYYNFTMRCRTPTIGGMTVGVYKNGNLELVIGNDATTNLTASTGSCLVYCNGTTDYLEPWAFINSTRQITGGPVDNWAEVYGPL